MIEQIMSQKFLFPIFFLTIISTNAWAQGVSHILPETRLAKRYYGNDYRWYKKNIPFFNCSDTTLQNVYYYRWQLDKAHLRNVGKLGYIVTEFLNDMSWDRNPYSSITSASTFHIYEGRWLKNRRYINDYINESTLKRGAKKMGF
jgi:hypothetical protein